MEDYHGKSFPEVIGIFIHHCGVIELYLNETIRVLSTDDILAERVLNVPLARRIDICKDLWSERTELKEDQIQSLCKDLYLIKDVRNQVAHNPIFSTKSEDGTVTQEVIVTRHCVNGAIEKKNLQRDTLAYAADSAGKLISVLNNILIAITKKRDGNKSA
ncbi:MAG: hypothetical protein PF795_00915 [Kiritimatiellae bacterium]|jgi:hypothetical protein|nr:hypothetical protein [Kiritimatiellia bacterium]